MRTLFRILGERLSTTVHRAKIALPSAYVFVVARVAVNLYWLGGKAGWLSRLLDPVADKMMVHVLKAVLSRRSSYMLTMWSPSLTHTEDSADGMITIDACLEEDCNHSAEPVMTPKPPKKGKSARKPVKKQSKKRRNK